ncbi:hypothetical protein [Pelagerythrobacter sp.]|uniref:hypothetical protein n=1 Tax=Pelagerythrobacter sp. TaxID=2800702 RepID=UPI0035B36DE1
MTRDDDVERAESNLGNLAILAGAGLLALFALGVLAGLITGAVENSGPPHPVIYIAGAVAALLLAFAAWLIRRHRRALTLPRSPRMREAGAILYLSAGLGFAATLALILLTGSEFGLDLFVSDGPIGREVALVMAAIVVIGMALSIRWFLLLDEHERAAHDFGTVVAFYAYLTISAIWWLLARGGLTPWPNGVLIFWLSLAVWVVGWAWRRRG